MIPGFSSQQARMNIGPAGVKSVLSPSYKHEGMQLSNGNRTVTSTVAGFKVAGVLDAKTTGKWYYEATIVEFGTDNDEIGVGVGSYKTPLNNYPGGSNNSIIYYWDNRILYNNSGQGAGSGAFTEGDVIGVELDADTRTVKFRKNGGAWSTYTNLSGGTDPLMPLVYSFRVGGQITINCGQAAWHTAPEAGYFGWNENAPLPARYWRYFTNRAPITSGLAHIVELELRTDIGGPNVATGGTATADQSHDASSVPSKAFDDDPTTFWGTTFNNAAPHWLQYDFGSGNSKAIVEASLQTRADTNEGQPADFRILYSYDGTTFFPAYGLGRATGIPQGSRNILRLFNNGDPAIVVKTSDEYYYNVGFQIGATGKANAAAYTADDSKYANVVALTNGAAIANQKFVFDGVNDYIYHNNANSALFTPGATTSWEMFGTEFNTTTGTQMLFANYRADNGGHGWRIYYESGALKVDVGATNSAVVTTPLSYTWAPLTNGQRYDILLTWNRAVFRLYINGVFVASAAYTDDIAQTNNVGISVGCDFGTSNVARNFFNGKMVAARLTCGVDRASGSTTTYVRDGLPLTKTQAALDDAFWGNVAFLMHGEGADASTKFRDLSPYDRRVLPLGAVQNDTDIAVGNTPSIKFDSDANYLQTAYGPELDITASTPNFCMEAYVYCTDVSLNNQIFGRRRNSGQYILHITGGNLVFWTFNGTTATTRLDVASGIANNTVAHVCVIRSGTTYYGFVNGVLVGSSSPAAGTVSAATTDLFIGQSENDQAARFWRGNLNWMRITMGATRYSLSGFTPPTIPYAIS